MNSFQNRLRQLINNHIGQAEYLNSLNPTSLNTQPDIKHWSAGQCLWHLNSYGDYYIPYLESSIKQAPLGNEPIKQTWLGKQFCKLMEPKENMVKFKAFKKNTPPALLTDKTPVTVFLEQSTSLLSLLNDSDHKNLNGRVIPVTALPFIKLSIADVLQFLVIHNERHIQQAMKAVRASVSS